MTRMPPLRAVLLVANLMAAGLVVVGQGEHARASHPPFVVSCPDLARAIAVHGQGHVLVRWFPSKSEPMSAAPVNGAFPTFHIARAKDGGAFVALAQVQRALDGDEAHARLTHGGGDDTALLVESAQLIDPGFAQGETHPYAKATLLAAVEFFEDDDQELARHSLANRAWRIAWALGMGWLDTGFVLADTMHHFQYRVHLQAAPGQPVVLKATTQNMLYFHAADKLSAPSSVDAKTIDDLPGPETDPALQDGSDWDSVQRRRWMDRSIALTWDHAEPNLGCAQSTSQNNLSPTVEFGAGYDIFRRPNCTVPNPPPSDPCKTHVKANDDPVFPKVPEHDYDYNKIKANGKPTNNDTDLPNQRPHVDFEAFFTDNTTTGLQLGKEYCYFVAKRNLLGEPGLASGEDCAYVIETIPPDPPRNFELRLVSNKVQARWNVPLGEPPVRYEVWRTKVLRQDMLPAPGDPPNQFGTSADRWSKRANVFPAPGQNAFTWVDFDPAVQQGDHYWYKVRGFDQPSGPVASFLYAGNPSAFTRPLSLGPEDTYPPMICPPDGHGTGGNRTGGGITPPPGTVGGKPGFAYPGTSPGNILVLAVPPDCFQIPFPDPNLVLPGQAGDGCVHLPQPLPQDARKVYWFQGDDETPDRLHLTRVFTNSGQSSYCNPIDLPWPMPLCVKLQAEDAVGNRGPRYPLPANECYLPSFSFHAIPAPPKPVITGTSLLGANVLVSWASPKPGWLKQFYLIEHQQQDIPPSGPGCPSPFPAMYGPFPKPSDAAGVPMPAALVTHFTVVAENLAGVRACSEPFVWQKDTTLPWAYHNNSPGELCLGASWVAGQGVALRFGIGKCDTTGGEGYFVVFRSLWEDQGFVPISPPIDHSPFIDRTAPDGRYYYRVAWVGLPKDVTGTIPDGEIAATSLAVQTGPKPTWPPTPPNNFACPAPPPPGSQSTIKELTFGEGQRKVTMILCWHKNEPMGPNAVAQVSNELIQGLFNNPPPQAQPQAQQVQQLGNQVVQATPSSPSANLPSASPVKITGLGLLKLDLPAVGIRYYPHGFTGLTVLPSVLCCAQTGQTAKVIAGKVTDAGAPGLYPFHVGAELGPADPPMYRYALNNVTLDKFGMNAAVTLRAPDSVRFSYLAPANPPPDFNVLPLGTLNLTAKVEWKKDRTVFNSPTHCNGPTTLAFDLTTLPLRLVPNENFTLTRNSMSQVTFCTQYRDPYVPNSGHPARAAPLSRHHVDTNDGFLRAAYAGSGHVGPTGAFAALSTAAPLAWVTAQPMGFLVQGQGATVNLAGSRITGGSVGGPVDVRGSYRVDTGGTDLSAVERRELHATFPAGMTMADGGALRGEGGTLDAADAEEIPWLNGALVLHDLQGPNWKLALGTVQSRGKDATGGLSDDGVGDDVMGPSSVDANQLVALGLNYLRASQDQKMTWECKDSVEPPLELPTEKVAINLRQSGLHQLVKAFIEDNAPVEFKVRGYKSELLYFQGVFLDSGFKTWDIRIRVFVPLPGDFNVLLLNAVVDEKGCVQGGDVPPGTVVRARAWNLLLAPETGEFKQVSDHTPDHDGCDPKDPAKKPAHCNGDYPHWQFWLLGWADLPHLQGPKPPSDIPKGFVPWDNAWTPQGQALAGFASHPALRVDGFNFTASKIELGKALDFECTKSVEFQCVSFYLEEDDQPGAGWMDGNLNPVVPCTGVDPGSYADRGPRCPPFLRYEGYFVLPYWLQSTAKVQLTAFVPGVRQQSALGLFSANPMPGATVLGFRAAPEFLRGWTEASDVSDKAMSMYYAQRPVANQPDGGVVQPGDPVGQLEKALLVGFLGGSSLGPTVSVNVGTMVSTYLPCAANPQDAKPCADGEPSLQMFQGMPAGPAVMRAAIEVLEPGLPVNAPPSQAVIEDRLAVLLAKTPLGAMDAQALDALWVDIGDCASGACYGGVAQVISTKLGNYDGGLDGNSDLNPPANMPPDMQHLSDSGGQQAATLEDWDIGVGEMRTTVVFSEKANGDFVFERLEIEVKFDDRSENNFLTAEVLLFTLDRHGVLTLDAKGVVAKFTEFEAQMDIFMRFETTRFDGGVSIGPFQVGSIVIDYFHGVFGAGSGANGAIFYFGISGQGHSETDSTTIGISFLFGTIDPVSKPILAQHGFQELIKYLDSGEAGATEMRGVYARAYGQIPIYGVSCILSLNGGAEIGFWFFEVVQANAEVYLFGAKFRIFAVGQAGCIVSVRGDVSLSFQDHVVNGTHNISAWGLGWFAGGLGFCDPETWTDWEQRWWDDDWCIICGAGITLDYVNKEWSADYDFGCG